MKKCCKKNLLENTGAKIWYLGSETQVRTILYPKDNFCKDCGAKLEKLETSSFYGVGADKVHVLYGFEALKAGEKK